MVVVVVAAVVVVVVVDVVEHTEMVTVWGNGGFSTVPAEGLWLCTWPAVPPLEEQSTCVNVGFRPGVPEIALPAALCESPTTLGTVAEQGPVDTTRLTGVFGGCWLPAAGTLRSDIPGGDLLRARGGLGPDREVAARDRGSRPRFARVRRRWAPEPMTG